MNQFSFLHLSDTFHTPKHQNHKVFHTYPYRIGIGIGYISSSVYRSDPTGMIF